MANKRQRKKKQTKQNIQLLKSIGRDEKEIKRLKNDSAYIKKEIEKKKKRDQYKYRSDLIRGLGLPLNKENSKKRSWGEKRFNEWYQKELKKKQKKDGLKQKKKKDLTDNYLQIYWRDKTAEGYSNIDEVKRLLHEYKYVDDSLLIANIKHYIKTRAPIGAEIGTTHTTVIKGNKRKSYASFMQHISDTSINYSDSNDWIIVYDAKAKRLHELLVAINAVVSLLYDAFERQNFFGNLIEKYLPQINIKMAQRLAEIFEWRSF